MSAIRKGFELELAEEDLALERKLVSNEEKEALLTALGAWLDKQTHLRVPRPETGFRLKMLRAAEFNLDKGKEIIEGYAKLRTYSPSLFVHKSAEVIKDEAFRTNLSKVCAAGAIDSTGPRVLIYLWGLMNHTQPELSVKAVSATMEFLASSPVNQIHGVERVMDFDGIKLTDLGGMRVSAMERYAEMVKKYSTLKLVRTHFVNAPAFVRGGFEAAKRAAGLTSYPVTFHKCPTSLAKFIKPEVLPTEYGGTAGSLDEMMMKWREFMDHKLATTECWDKLEYFKEHPAEAE